MSYEKKGKLLLLEDTNKISDKFRKREFVLEDSENPDYVQLIKFQATQDGCDKLDSFIVGDLVNVHFNVKGRKWEKDGKVSYFNSLDAWKFEKLDVSSGSSSIPTQEDEGVENELPF